MAVAITRPQCEERVYAAGAWRPHRCRRGASYRYDPAGAAAGVAFYYCGQHFARAITPAAERQFEADHPRKCDPHRWDIDVDASRSYIVYTCDKCGRKINIPIPVAPRMTDVDAGRDAARRDYVAAYIDERRKEHRIT